MGQIARIFCGGAGAKLVCRISLKLPLCSLWPLLTPEGGWKAGAERARCRPIFWQNRCIYIYIYIYIHTHIYIYIYIYVHTNVAPTSGRQRKLIPEHALRTSARVSPPMLGTQPFVRSPPCLSRVPAANQLIVSVGWISPRQRESPDSFGSGPVDSYIYIYIYMHIIYIYIYCIYTYIYIYIYTYICI